MVPPTSGTAGEREILHAWLGQHRDAVLWKIEGLDAVQVRRPMTRPTGTNLLGLVKHLAGMEAAWLCAPFGRKTDPMPWYEGERAWQGDDMWARHDESADFIATLYRRTCASADQTINALDLDATGTRWTGEEISLRYALITMVGETARHAGHADILRELIDGTIGAFRDNPYADGTDEEFWQNYLARMRAGTAAVDTGTGEPSGEMPPR